MKNIKEHTANKIGVTQRYLEYLLAGDRDATGGTARKIARFTKTNKELWVFGSKRERQCAWKKYVKAKKGGK